MYSSRKSLKIPCALSGEMWMWCTAGRDLWWSFQRLNRYKSDISFLTCLSFIPTSCILFNSGGPICNVTTEILVCDLHTLGGGGEGGAKNHILRVISQGLSHFRRCFLSRPVHLLTVCTRLLPLDEARKLPISADLQNFFFCEGVYFDSWPGFLLPRMGFVVFFLAFSRNWEKRLLDL
jgi:hypothetical protein